ncbi:response regulator transcription factor [Diaphorobacter aerolatus]|uniref:Response regulator transcription factor n=1 Tax=Diaphorobacter aerolatus TaxID=1288495 RepID=A0A7H0GMZ8_9BURK|nr:response regulator transcription factor [Diaphorobacter aerolatus]QNP49664.1 response regulator transcription factor [Diaphorobacter aerolatus]
MQSTNEQPASFGSAAVIDDHPLVAKGLAEYLTSHCRFDDAKIFVSASEFLSRPFEERSGFSLFLVDFWIDRQAASSFLTQLLSSHPHSRLLVISADSGSEVPTHVKSCGAHGFIGKHATPDEFIKVVQSVMQKKTTFSMPNDEENGPATLQLELVTRYGLTERQAEVMSLAMRGWTNKRIADRLGMGEQTAKDHMSVVLSKLGVRNRVEAIALLAGQRL